MFTKERIKISYRNDVFFKYALSSQDEASKSILHFIIKEVTGIEPYESFILNGEMVPEQMEGKKIILDVRVRDNQGNQYDIEMQMGNRDAVLKRFEYYGAKVLTSQLEKGMNYEQLKPVYQIIFIDGYDASKRSLIDTYQMYNKEGEVESEEALIHRIYINLSLINAIAKEKGMGGMSGFEKMCYLFKNDADSVIMKTEEKVVRLLMEKYEEMKEDKSVFTLAESIAWGEWEVRARLKHGIKEGLEKGLEKGIKKGIKKGIQKGKQEGIQEGIYNVLQQQIQAKYEVDASKWLSTLPSEQLEKVTTLLLTTNTFEELQQSIE